MNTALLYLTYVTAFTGLLWIPYVLNRFIVWGIVDTVSYPMNPKSLAPWAERMMKAHKNAVENLVVFATLVLIAQAAGIAATNTVIATACMAYFWARVAHLVLYVLGVSWLRTLAFVAGFLCQAAIALQLLGH